MTDDARRSARLSYLRGLEEGLSSATWLFALTLVCAFLCTIVVLGDHQRVLLMQRPLTLPWAIAWASPFAAMIVFVGYMARVAWVVDRRSVFIYPVLALLYVFLSTGGALLAAFLLQARLRYTLQSIIKLVAYHDDEL